MGCYRWRTAGVGQASSHLVPRAAAREANRLVAVVGGVKAPNQLGSVAAQLVVLYRRMK